MFSLTKSHAKSEATRYQQQELHSGRFGLEILHDGDSCVLDIVFVHGITGNRESTWTAQTGSESIFWPRDLLPRDVPDSRIVTWGYDADVVGFWAMASQNRIGEHAGNFVNQVTGMRERTNTEDRPILLVTHSMGGLVAEDALVYSKNSPEQHLRKFHEYVAGICFLGTPHCGSDLAKWGTILSTLVNVVKTSNTQLVGTLRSDSEILGRVQRDFHSMLRNDTHKMNITCFYEELPVRGVGEIVQKHSAVLPSYNAIGIRADHMQMTKYRDMADPGYLAVSGELLRWAKTIRSSTRQPENSYIQQPSTYGIPSHNYSRTSYHNDREEGIYNDDWRSAPPTQVQQGNEYSRVFGGSDQSSQMQLGRAEQSLSSRPEYVGQPYPGMHAHSQQRSQQHPHPQQPYEGYAPRQERSSGRPDQPYGYDPPRTEEYGRHQQSYDYNASPPPRSNQHQWGQPPSQDPRQYHPEARGSPNVTNNQYTYAGGKTVSGNTMNVTGGNISF